MFDKFFEKRRAKFAAKEQAIRDKHEANYQEFLKSGDERWYADGITYTKDPYLTPTTASPIIVHMPDGSVCVSGGQLSLTDWVDQVADLLFLSDDSDETYPRGFYWFVADNLAHSGAYDKYLAGDYGGELYTPDAP